MSRTNKRSGSQSPVKKYLSFSGSKGQIKYFQKDHGDADDKGNVYLDSIDLTVLDIRASISGYNENASAGISSNLLIPYDTGKEEFVVKTKVNGQFGEFARGVWKDIKDKVTGIGGKFTTNVFALADLGNGQEIVRLELNGSGLSPWIELMDELENDDDIYDLLVTVNKGELLTRKKGKTAKVSDAEYKKVLAAIKKDPMYQRPVWFYAPEFVTSELSEDLANLAVEQDEVLQAYFETIGSASPVEEQESPTATSPEPAPDTDDDGDDLPF